MISPSREEFRSLAATWTVVPVWREVVADLATPVAAFLRLVGDGPGFLLESVERERWGRFSFVGRNPVGTLIAHGGRVTATGDVLDGVPGDQGILAAVEHTLTRLRSPSLAGLPPLHGGLVGYLGYDVVREIEDLGQPPPDDLGYPDAVLSVIGQIAAFDHWRQRVTLVDNVVVRPGMSDADLDAAYDAATVRLDQLARDGAGPLDERVLEPPPPKVEPIDVGRSISVPDYLDGVKVAKEHIYAGDIFQVQLSVRFDFDLGADPLDVYRVLRQINPSPYMYFVRDPHLTIVGSSPETMVRMRDGTVVARPIAGTRRRGRDEDDDRRMAGELAEDPKERAEHIMLVDLTRNDLGRVVEFGTERVDELMVLERYSHVIHLTSEVSGRLRSGLGPVDVLRATFPAGTLTGAPKVRAMEIIDELEPVKRGPYGGVVGYIDFSGNLDTAIAIRTMLVAPDGTASVQSAAGVVADSDPELEELECRNKAAALLAAVPTARRMTAQRARAAPR